MTLAYFDCFSGAGGDMIVASLIDAGADIAALQHGLAGLGVGGYALTIEPVKKQGFAATRFHVALEDEKHQPHRHLKDVLKIIDSAANLSTKVKENAGRIFRRLAEAEAAVHGTDINKVHFHEVGAVDAILDVVGACLALELLGVTRVVCSPIPTGSGTVICSHGVMPVPAPATAELLKGVPIATTDEVGELTTPTAAAILTTLAESFGPIPAMTVRATGYGAGTRDGRTCPNVLRVWIGDPASVASAIEYDRPAGTVPLELDEVVVLETNLDDATPQVVAYCIERLLTGGALDAFAVPIQMKKSRPGLLLTAIAEAARVGELERILFTETPTFGIRRHRTQRTKLARRHVSVSTPFGEIRVKVGEGAGASTATPEFDDCLAAAKRSGAALRDVMEAARSAFHKLGS